MFKQDLEEYYDFNYESELIEQYRQQKYKEYIKHKNKRNYKNRKYLSYKSVFDYTTDDVVNNQMSDEFNGYRGIGQKWGTVSNVTPKYITRIVEKVDKSNDFGVSIEYQRGNSFSQPTVKYVVVDLKTHDYNILYAKPDDYIKGIKQLDLVGTINSVNNTLTKMGISFEYHILDRDIQNLKPFDFNKEESLLERFLISGYFSKYHNTLYSVFNEYKSLRGVTPIGWENKALQVLCNVNKRIPKIEKYYSNKQVVERTINRGQYKNYKKINRYQTKQELNKVVKNYDKDYPMGVDEIIDNVHNLTSTNMDVEWD